MQNFSASPREMVASFWRNRSLIKSLAEREILGRYRGSFLGIFWSFVNPIFMLLVYTFVFSVIFKARWNAGSDSRTEFAMVLFAGLMVFNFFAEVINRSPSLILNNVNYVTKVVFPLEILPMVAIASALFHLLISLIVWLLAYGLIFGMPHITALMIPIVILPLLLFSIGLSWGFASLGVYLRDLSQFLGVVVTVLMFLSPIFYPISSIPENYQGLLLLNPLTPVIEMTRQVLYMGELPNLSILGLYIGAGVLFAGLGFFWFQKTRKGFADVL
ncbi:TagG ABC-type polysaccharide/polyol phosphate export systems, permease component [Candidatus Methylopumilus universalis]|uniref:ABC transporter permease n=1 Tax=Candidatus Methylopumilus universalis TaxID=2588536 RepID=UPI003BEEBE08